MRGGPGLPGDAGHGPCQCRGLDHGAGVLASVRPAAHLLAGRRHRRHQPEARHARLGRLGALSGRVGPAVGAGRAREARELALGLHRHQHARAEARSRRSTTAPSCSSSTRRWCSAPTRCRAVRSSPTATRRSVARAAYPPPASLPPSVLLCDTVSADTWWSGTRLGERAEAWTRLLTDGKGRYCTTQQEDNATYEAFKRATAAGLADDSRVAVLRAGSDFDRPAPGGECGRQHAGLCAAGRVRAGAAEIGAGGDSAGERNRRELGGVEGWSAERMTWRYERPTVG